ncbi:hypothetical protein XBFFL1_2160013 [Xenorhabdus bovienii str. feltiae Florida]|uniref:Uncharacterized protein n=2 Tax=Xenorhabdus bovienii TaxID=40576 RepID=A0A0B6XG85_XENBV|nr:hypothetical protein XBFFR1_260024 [Xenorhabdus bovienii str. feltiae France]CDG92335.1 hypothetical protein XBFFL1_2160013 [Xenorhabdus bovienii str. feltiae Florida]CDG99778.1 hypothetical protein XBFM1_1190038 [Xenorhabdus bovienii str. feltiae Moldova]CDM91639.1 protein of unknown function [Xenorhabdus bovienii]
MFIFNMLKITKHKPSQSTNTLHEAFSIQASVLISNNYTTKQSI